MPHTHEENNVRTAPDLRQEKIVELVNAQGFVSTESLAKHFNVTTQTIRGDINRLCRSGRLRRYHGGAGLVSTLDNATFVQRRALVPEEKKRIAIAIARQIPNRASIFLHYGTTMEAVADALQNHKDLLILTNNISAVSFAPNDGASRVMLAGGDVSVKERCTRGAATTNFLREFNVDFGLLSVGCIGEDGTLFEYDYELSCTARAILDQSRQVFLAVDHRKFGREGLTRVGHLREVTALFTNRPPPPAIGVMLSEHRIELVVTGNRGNTAPQSATPQI